MAWSVKRPTSAQVMISLSMSSSPASGSVLTAQSLEPVSDSVTPSLSAPPLLVLSLSQNKTLKKKSTVSALSLYTCALNLEFLATFMCNPQEVNTMSIVGIEIVY